MAERKSRIYLCLAHMSGNEMKYIQEAFDTNWVVPLGPNVNGFEADLEAFVNSIKVDSGAGERKIVDFSVGNKVVNFSLEVSVDDKKGTAYKKTLDKKVVALSAGTAAVHLALIACGVGPGDEVLVQSFTFCASSHPVTYLGATPVFIDSEEDTWNMDPQLLEEAIKTAWQRPARSPRPLFLSTFTVCRPR